MKVTDFRLWPESSVTIPELSFAFWPATCFEFGWLALNSELIGLGHGWNTPEATLHYHRRTEWSWKDNICPRLLTWG